MNLRFIDRIWHVRGDVALADGQSPRDALDRIDPLFREYGTSHERIGDRIAFRKKDQAAQDKMSIFDRGDLWIEQDAAGSVLRYDLTSKILLICFLAPLFFIGIAQLTILSGRFQNSMASSAGQTRKTEVAKHKLEEKLAKMPMNPIDKALGAPAPEKPGKKDKKEAAGRDKKPSPTAAYVFATLFAILYVVGRVLESRLVQALFRTALLGNDRRMSMFTDRPWYRFRGRPARAATKGGIA